MSLPLVLAGPILRRVDAASGVSVFMAFSQETEVELHVWAQTQVSTGAGSVQSGQAKVAVGTAGTRRIGKNLHLVVVTAKPTVALTPGQIHSYDVVFGGGSKSLRTEGLLRDETAGNRIANVDHDNAPLHLALGYATDRLPSFVAAPAKLAQLRISHTSCRKASYDGPDALGWLDELMLHAAGNPVDAWPHQLFLTGDQIYADDVNALMLPPLTRLGQDLLGARESFWLTEGFTCAVEGKSLPPLRRGTVVRKQAQMTTSDSANHLLGFGEFAAMYLLSWSSRVWRALGSEAEVFVPYDQISDDSRQYVTKWEECASFDAWKTKSKESWDKWTNAATAFRNDVPKVARVLANVPTYMIWDDHEVTDDWNLSGRWTARVYSNAGGRAIIRNGCVAYGLFQGWGNDPEAFTSGKNKAFLDEAEKLYAGAGPYPTIATGAMETLVGFPSAGADDRAKWHYQVDSPCHRTIVLDTRTRRDVGSLISVAPPKLLGDTLDQQVPAGPLTNGLELMVLVAAAPVLNPDLFEHVIQPLAAGVGDVLTTKSDTFEGTLKPCEALTKTLEHETGAEHYDAETWSGNQAHQEALLKRLATYERCIILSGDVHFSATLALDYWRWNKDEQDAAKQTKVSRIVQFTSSAERNGWPPDVASQLRRNTVFQDLTKGVLVERLGWEGPADLSVPTTQHIGPGRRARTKRSPALLPASGWPSGTAFTKTDEGKDKLPDWRWRLTLISDRRTGGQNGAPPDPPALDRPDDDTRAGYAAALRRHQLTALTQAPLMRTMVFNTSVALLSFNADLPDPTIVNRIISGPVGSGATPTVATVHEVSLARPAVAAQPVIVLQGA